jgi:hypothetical protein
VQLRHLAIAVTLVVACKKAGPPSDPDLELARTIANDSLVKVEQAIADARARSPRNASAGYDSCAAATATLGKLHASADAALAIKLEQLCNYELPMAELTASVLAVEDDQAACTNAQAVKLAQAALARAGRLDAAAGLVARYEARCGS